MDSTSSHDAGSKTIAGGRLSIASLRRGTTLRVVISLIAVWFASSFVKTPKQNTDAFFPGLGEEILDDKKYGLSKEKLAVVFDPEHHPHSAFHLLHTISTLPSDWPLLYVGTHKSIVNLNTSYAIKVAQQKGRLTLQPAPEWLKLTGEETLQRLFAREEFYNSLPSEVEHLFISGMDSIMCSAATTTMDDLLEYDWIGSAWSGNTWSAGLNGYSLRRVSKVREVLRTQSRLDPITDDAELMEAIARSKKVRLPPPVLADYFVMEDEWVERPMAYHPRTSLLREPGWDKQGYRSGTWSHCPELKVILEMKLERERCTPAQLEEMAKEAAAAKKPIPKPLKGGNSASKPAAADEEEEVEVTETVTEAAASATQSAADDASGTTGSAASDSTDASTTADAASAANADAVDNGSVKKPKAGANAYDYGMRK